RGEAELTQAIAAGTPPTHAKAHDYDGLAAAYLRYPMCREPGETRERVLAFPLGTEKIDPRAGKLPEAPVLDIPALAAAKPDPSAGFDVLADQVARTWRERTWHAGIELPDHDLVDMLHAQIAYILINQTGP